MRKSLLVIASALLLAVAAANHERLRYDSTAFADARLTAGPRAVRLEYPPCVKGVVEDRCIQLYERGVRRSYARWREAHGLDRARTAAAAPSRARAYPPCRSRSDDRCQQRASSRQVRAATRARTQQVQRRAATRAAARRQAARPTTRAVVRQQARPAPVQRQRPGTRALTPVQPRPGPASTPGI